MSQFDFTDQQLIKALTKDARIAFSELAKNLNISNSMVHQRVRKLLENNIIKKWTLQLNPKALGYESVTYTGIVTRAANFSKHVAEELEKIDEVVECHYVSGKYALLIKIVAKNNEHLRQVLYDRIHPIEGVGSTDSFISFGNVFEKNLPL